MRFNSRASTKPMVITRGGRVSVTKMVVPFSGQPGQCMEAGWMSVPIHMRMYKAFTFTLEPRAPCWKEERQLLARGAKHVNWLM